MLCNPPYVRSADIARLAPEIAWEPRCALDGGADGLDGFHAVMDGAARLLAVDGVAAFEIGDGQARAVGDPMRAAGFGGVVEHRDLSGAVRCLSVRRFAAADIGDGANSVRFPSLPFSRGRWQAGYQEAEPLIGLRMRNQSQVIELTD